MRFKIKPLFGETIAERGKKYYQQGRVTSILQIDSMVTAKVVGRSTYSTSINLETDEFECNCPYYDKCKHLAALFYELNKKKNIQKLKTDSLEDKSKDELINVIKEMLLKEPTLNIFLLGKEDRIMKQIAELDTEDEDEWVEFYDYIPDRVEKILVDLEKIEKPITHLLALLEKVQELNIKYDQHGSTTDTLHFLLEDIFNHKRDLSKNEQEKIFNKIVSVLGEDYKSYVEEFENEE